MHLNFGYSISFDVKVAGIYNQNNAVRIVPQFYFLKKNATGSSDIIENILLFYKNSDGKYVQVGSKSDKYNLTFRPNDPYRLKEVSTKKYLSSEIISLGSLTELYLNAKNAATNRSIITQGFTGSVTTYYGEYKLPNTTIAVAVEDGKYNINEPLTNGYIGVKFDMTAGSKKSSTFEESTKYMDSNQLKEYNSEGKKYGGIWELEKYFGTNEKFRIEGASLNITDYNVYNKLVGTVILYDADARASDDYN